MLATLPPGREFELYTAGIYRQLFPNLDFTINERVRGQSGFRQIDLSVRKNGSIDQIIEAKDWTKKINIGLVDQLIGKADDVGVRAAMVSSSGYSARALERAKLRQEISLLTVLDPVSLNTWAFPFFAHSVVAITLIEELFIKFCEDDGFINAADQTELLCTEIFDEERVVVGRLHDIIFELENLPLEPEIHVFEGQIFVRNLNSSGKRRLAISVMMRLRTEAWEGSLPMLFGKGLYDQNLGKATVTPDSKFEAVPWQFLRQRWTRLNSVDSFCAGSPFHIQLVGLPQQMFPSERCPSCPREP